MSLLNIHRLLPSRVVSEVEALDISLPGKEGFIRLVPGWREFVHHVYMATHGFRVGLQPSPDLFGKPGDGGYRIWDGKAWTTTGTEADPPGGDSPAWLGGETHLSLAFWGETSGLTCLEAVVSSVWAEVYSHHITRFMGLANIATLLDASPPGLTDWFSIAYTDEYDWVVEPHVLGIGTYAVGSLMTTKPYITGANYINRVSDFCQGCQYDPAESGPITPLYWAFLARHESALRRNPRLSMVMKSLDNRQGLAKNRDKQGYDFMRTRLAEASLCGPQDLARL